MKKIVSASLIILLFISCKQGNLEHENKENMDKKDLLSETSTDYPNIIPERIVFPSKDGLSIFANYYEINEDAPAIVLCHQAGYNKYEYAEIAPMLLSLGYNCLAIDQRSGGMLDTFNNETALMASKTGIRDELKAGENLLMDFLSAEQDILAAIDYMYEKTQKNIVLFGSSYSATLACFIAPENNKVKALIAFSPGDYFNSSKSSLSDHLKGFSKPFFITSAKEEAGKVKKLLKQVKFQENQVHFIPKNNGSHGAKALWNNCKHQQEYRNALSDFLVHIKES